MIKPRTRLSAFDWLLIALMAGLGLAVKPVIAPLTHLITGPLFIPGGSVAGGFYMLWLVLAAALTQKRGSAALTGLVQGIIVMATGAFGSHGVASLVTYTLPGLAIEGLWLMMRSRGQTLSACFFAGMLANLTGTLLSNALFFRLPTLPLILSLSSAALSGAFGGIIAHRLAARIRKSGKMQTFFTADSKGDPTP